MTEGDMFEVDCGDVKVDLHVRLTSDEDENDDDDCFKHCNV